MYLIRTLFITLFIFYFTDALAQDSNKDRRAEYLKAKEQERQKRKKKACVRGSEIESVSIGCGAYTDISRSPGLKLISCNLEAGGSTFRTRAYIVCSNTVSLNTADNKAWFAKALGYPANSINTPKWGGSDEAMAYLMPVLYEKDRIAIATGGGAGLLISGFPSASINTGNTKEYIGYNLLNVCAVAGLRAEVFYGHFFTLRVEYVATLGSPNVKLQMNGNTIATSVYDCTHFGIAIGYRFAHEKQEEYVPHNW